MNLSQYGNYSQVGRSGVDTASSSDARGPRFEPRQLRLKKYHCFTPNTLKENKFRQKLRESLKARNLSSKRV